MSSNIDMTKGKSLTCIVKFAVPLMIGNVLQQLYIFFDTLIVGNYIGINGLAALGATEWLMFIIISGSAGITHGFSINMAQSIGRKDTKSFNEAVYNSIVFFGVLYVLICIIALSFSKYILLFLNTPPEVIDLANSYISIMYLGLFITIFYNLSASILRAIGDSSTPLKALVIASVINILLDYVLIYNFKLSVIGAALGTLIAQLFALVVCIRKLYKQRIINISLKKSKLNYAMIMQLLKLGIPLGLQNVIIGIGGVVVQSVINGYGVVFVAAYTSANKLYGLLEIIASSLSNAMATFAGQNSGAKNYIRIKQGMKQLTIIGIVVAYLMSGIMFFGVRYILSCFIAAEESVKISAISIGIEFLSVLSIFFPLLYILYVLYGVIQGMGHSFISMLSSAAQLIMRILCALFLTRIIGYRGFFIGEVLAWIGADLILLGGYVYSIRRICQ